LHAEAVRRVEILNEARYGDKPYAPEVMPIVEKTAPLKTTDDYEDSEDGDKTYVNEGVTTVFNT
jgi:hypothetical protein